MAGKKADVLLSARIFAKVMGMRMEARPPSTGAFARHLQEFEAIREFLTSATVAALVDIPFALLFCSLSGFLPATWCGRLYCHVAAAGGQPAGAATVAP
ncbi:hypothetical protein MBH78_15495 [Oceanimonas sp. NS1]|nr:hypothetical protein [Oceanimonas sp. NS1]